MAGGSFNGMGGAYAAMITPFTKDDKVNEGAIEKLIEHGLEGGLAGFYLTGGTGEGLRRARPGFSGVCPQIFYMKV